MPGKIPLLLKVSLAPLVAGLIFLAILAWQAHTTGEMEQDAAAINQTGSQRMRLFKLVILTEQYIAYREPKIRASIDKEITTFEAILQRLKHGDPQYNLKSIDDPGFIALLDKNTEEWNKTIKPLLQSVLVASSASRETFRTWEDRVEEYVVRIDGSAALGQAYSEKKLDTLRNLLWLFLFASIVITLGSLIYVRLIILKPIRMLAEASRTIAAGDLSRAVPVLSKDEIGAPAGDFNEMSVRLKNHIETPHQRKVELEAQNALIEADRLAIQGLKRYAEDIIASLPTGLIVVDDALKVVSVNRSFRKLFGLKNGEDVAGRDLENVLPLLGLREHAQGVLASGTAVGGIDAAVGERRLRLAIAGIRLEEEEELLVVVEDLSEEESLREQTRAHETRYRSLFENMLHGFAYCRMLFEDNRPQDFIYLEVNIAFEKLTGLKNVVGKRVTEVIPGIREAHPELFETYGRVALTGQPERFELYFKPLESWLSITVYSTGEGCFVAIFDNITERKQTEQALHDYARRLRGVSRRLFAVEETERRNINRELHDRIGQSLAALNINLNIIRSQLPQQSLDAVGARFRDTQTLLEETVVQIRDVMADLHPPTLDDYGLLAALRTYAESFGARAAVPITVHGEDLTPRLSLAAEMALFRIAQEALANAVKHARARNIEVALGATPERVTLTIDDDGVGFNAEYTMSARRGRRFDDGVGFDAGHTMPAGNHWGLATMRERADAVGATLRIESVPGRGVHVIVQVPRSAA